jgi:hypothetical protein
LFNIQVLNFSCYLILNVAIWTAKLQLQFGRTFKGFGTNLPNSVLSSAYNRAAGLPQTTQTSITNTGLPTNIRIKYKINPKEHITTMVPTTDHRLIT